MAEVKLLDVVIYDADDPTLDLIVVGICPTCADHILVYTQCGAPFDRLNESFNIWKSEDIVTDPERKASAIKAIVASDYEHGKIHTYLHHGINRSCEVITAVIR